VVAAAFLERLSPENCMISITDSGLSKEKPEEWLVEPWYGATYRESHMSPEKMEEWGNPAEIDSQLHLPALNNYIPTDFSLRCDDEGNGENLSEVEREESRKEFPKLLHESKNFRMWHKMDRFWRVPKTFIRLSVVSPKVYESPRTMTFSRIYQRVLNDDLNSFVYDASLAGCNYRYANLIPNPSWHCCCFSPHVVFFATTELAALQLGTRSRFEDTRKSFRPCWTL
jgi:secreted Zn-dependent insulinase-like peptidase